MRYKGKVGKVIRTFSLNTNVLVASVPINYRSKSKQDPPKETLLAYDKWPSDTNQQLSPNTPSCHYLSLLLPGSFLFSPDNAKNMVHQVQVVVVEARQLLNKEIVGKQDPFVKFGFDTEQMQRTHTHQAGGQFPQWDQTFTVLSHGTHLLVEVYDEDILSHDLVGFAAIPMEQVFQAGPEGLNGWFQLFMLDNAQPQGEIHLKFSPPGTMCKTRDVKGQSVVLEEHTKRLHAQTMHKTIKEVTGEIGAVGKAITSTLFGKKQKLPAH
jgi:hypothetical protein